MVGVLISGDTWLLIFFILRTLTLLCHQLVTKLRQNFLYYSVIKRGSNQYIFNTFDTFTDFFDCAFDLQRYLLFSYVD